MTAFSWTTGISGDWNTATNWTPATVPNAATADVTIDAPPAAGVNGYTVTIAPGANDIVNSLILNAVNNLLGINPTAPAPYKGAILADNGTLTFAPGSAGTLGGPLQSVVDMTNGAMVNAGTVDAFVQTAGMTTFTGTNAIYFTNWLQSLGITTIDTTSIGEYSAAAKTLTDGIFEAKGTGTAIYFGGKGGGLAVQMTTVQGPKAVVTPDFWTQLIFDDTGSVLDEWNGTTYVPVESTITTVGQSGIITVTGGRNYLTANTLTILADGLFEQTSGTLQTAGLTIAAGGILTSGLEDPHLGTFAASTDAGPATVTGSVANNGTVLAFGGGMDFTGPITGTGTLTYGGTSILSVGSVAAGQTVAMVGGDTLDLTAPASFAGTITVAGSGNTIDLAAGFVGTITGNMLQIAQNGTVLDSIALTGTTAGVTVANAATPGLTVIDTTAKTPVAAVATPYTGPVAGLTEQYINVTSDSLAITATTPNWFLHSGSGNDALQVSSGTNVLDGGTGSNFLVGGTGTDTFFVDDRGAAASIWSTVVNFHAGDSATIFGITQAGFTINEFDNQGAAGYTGLTIGATSPGTPGATLTLSGFSQADIASGKLTVTFGTDPASGSPYMLIQGH